AHTRTHTQKHTHTHTHTHTQYVQDIRLVSLAAFIDVSHFEGREKHQAGYGLLLFIMCQRLLPASLTRLLILFVDHTHTHSHTHTHTQTQRDTNENTNTCALQTHVY